MTGDLAVTPGPPLVERILSASAALHRPTAAAPAARLSVPMARSTAADRSGTEELSAARLKALLADPTVRVRAHHDDASARVVLQVLDRTTGDVIEQYPPDQLLRFYAALRESLGALVDECA